MDIILGLALSLHLGLEGDYNEIHPHVQVRDGYFIAGAYYNSENKLSPYLGIRSEGELGYLEFGIVDGYDAFDAPVPFTRIGYTLDDNTSIFVSPALEKINKNVTSGLVIGLEVSY